MTVENGTAVVLAYVLVSMGVIIVFLLAAFVIGWTLPTPEAKSSDLAAMSAAENVRCDLVHNAPPISSLIARDSRFAEWEVMECRRDSGRTYSALMLAARITLAHFSVSSRMRLPKSTENFRTFWVALGA
jgi:hypothetical protein